MEAINNLMPFIQIGSAVVTAVWAVFKIKATAENLGVNIDHLSQAVVELKAYQKELSKEFTASKEHVAAELAAIRERLAVIENRISK